MKEEEKELAQTDLVEMDFLEKVMARLPQDVDVLEALGELYTRAGRYEDGLAVDEKLIKLEPDDMTVWYNLGCSLALLNRRQSAIKALQHAIELGYADHDWMRQDSDLESLRGDASFKALLDRIAEPLPESGGE